MRYPLQIREPEGEPMPFGLIRIRNKGHIRPQPIRVLVDTGSPWTAIAPWHSYILQIPTDSLEVSKDISRVGFAEHRFERRLLKGVEIRMEDESGKVQGFNVPNVSVLSHSSKPANDFKELRSIIGTSFLKQTGLKLHFDPAEGEAWLEK